MTFDTTPFDYNEHLDYNEHFEPNFSMRFHEGNWRYDGAEVAGLIEEISFWQGIPSNNLDELIERSGKLFGLRVAEELAKLTRCIELTVPRWGLESTGFSGISLRKRMTVHDSDWLDPSSGKKEGDPIPFYQENIGGPGTIRMLLDVSSSLEIVRLTSACKEGNNNDSDFNCYATSSNKPYAAVYRKGSDTPLTMCNGRDGKTHFFDDSDISEETKAEFVKFINEEVFEILKKLGMTFDCQMEIAYKDEKFYLVQLRPAPGQIRNNTGGECPGVNLEEGSLLSPVVSGAFEKKDLQVVIISLNEESESSKIKINGKEKNLIEVGLVSMRNCCVIVENPLVNTDQYLRIYSNLDETNVVIADTIVGPNTQHGRYPSKDFEGASLQGEIITCEDYRCSAVSLGRKYPLEFENKRVKITSNGYVCAIESLFQS